MTLVGHDPNNTAESAKYPSKTRIVFLLENRRVSVILVSEYKFYKPASTARRQSLKDFGRFTLFSLWGREKK